MKTGIRITTMFMALFIAFPAFARTQGWGATLDIHTDYLAGEIKKSGPDTLKVRGFEVGQAYMVLVMPDPAYLDDPAENLNIEIRFADGNISDSTFWEHVLGAYTNMVYRAEAEELQIVISSATGDTGHYLIKIEEARDAPTLISGMPGATTLVDGYNQSNELIMIGSDIDTWWGQLPVTNFKSGNVVVNNLWLEKFVPYTYTVNGADYTSLRWEKVPSAVHIVDGIVYIIPSEVECVGIHEIVRYKIVEEVFGVGWFPGSYLAFYIMPSVTEPVSGSFEEVEASTTGFIWSDGRAWFSDEKVVQNYVYLGVLTN